MEQSDILYKKLKLALDQVSKLSAEVTDTQYNYQSTPEGAEVDAGSWSDKLAENTQTVHEQSTDDFVQTRPIFTLPEWTKIMHAMPFEVYVNGRYISPSYKHALPYPSTYSPYYPSMPYPYGWNPVYPVAPMSFNHPMSPNMNYPRAQMPLGSHPNPAYMPSLQHHVPGGYPTGGMKQSPSHRNSDQGSQNPQRNERRSEAELCTSGVLVDGVCIM